MITYSDVMAKHIDLSPLGVMQEGAETYQYFCTPVGANIFGYAGVDGIHYCFVPGFGEMVFAVSPMNAPGSYVRPLARSFEDFLRLLLACGSADALEQIGGWDKEPQFNAWLDENPPSIMQQAATDEIRSQLGLTAIAEPFTYVKGLQSSFDINLLPLPEEAFPMVPAPQEALPDWTVSFTSGFWGHPGRDRPGREIPINHAFQWGGNTWVVLSLYDCGQGMVIDYAVQATAERIRATMAQYERLTEGGRALTQDEQMQLKAENPLGADTHIEATVNGRALRQTHGYGTSWIPCLSDGTCNDRESEAAMAHYGLSRDAGWAFHRAALPWATKRRPVLKTISVTLRREPVALPGPHFCISKPGDSVTFTHPVTGETHRLTALTCEQQRTSIAPGFPAHLVSMDYTVFPPLPENALRLSDCAPSDPLQNPPQIAGATEAAAVGIIGGADGPTVIIMSSGGAGTQRAVSSLHYRPVTDVEWRITFYETPCEDIHIDLF